MDFNFSICDHKRADGFIDMGVSRPVKQPNFVGLVCDIIQCGLAVANGVHPKDHPEGKTNLPSWCPAQYPNTGAKSAPGMAWCVGAIDYDKKATHATAKAVAEAIGVNCFVHTTSHHSPAAPSYRAVVELSRPLKDTEIASFLAWAHKRLGDGVNRSAKDIGRRMFMPHGKNESHMETDIGALDVDAMLAEFPIASQTRSEAPVMQGTPQNDPSDPYVRSRAGAYLQRVIEGGCADIADAMDGDQNNQIFKRAARVYGFIAGGALDLAPEIDGKPITEDDIYARLHKAAEDGNHEPHRIPKAIASGRKAGYEHPRSLLDVLDVNDGTTIEATPAVYDAAEPVKPAKPPAPKPDAKLRTEAPVDMLPPILRDAINTLQYRLNKPVELCLQCVLAAANFASLGHGDVDTRWYGVRPISEYFIAIAPPSEGKSTVYDEVMKGINRYLEEEKLRHIQDKRVHDLAMRIYQNKIKKIEREVEDMDEITEALKKLKEPSPVLGYLRLCSNPTVNGLIVQARSVPTLGIFTDEAGELLNGYANRDQQASTQLLTMFTKAWSGRPFERTTAVDQDHYPDRRFSILLMVQPIIVAPYLNNVMNNGQGGLNRFLITQFEEQDDAEEQRVDSEELARLMKPFCDRTYELLKAGVAIKTPEDFCCDLKPLEWEDGADAIVPAWYEEHVKPRRKTVYKPIKALAKRMTEHVFRLAATMAIFDGPLTITADHARAACALGEYYLAERLRALDIDEAPDKDNRMYHRALHVMEKIAHLHETTGETEWTLSDLHRKINAYRKSDKKAKNEIMSVIIESGWMRNVPVADPANDKITHYMYEITESGKAPS